MKRLTKRVGVGEAVNIGDFNICAPFIKSGYCKTGMQGGFPRRWERHCNDTCPLGIMIDRLADIEDILGEDYNLDTLRELTKTKRDN